jgi:Ca-activated chloride channel family protein
VAFNRNPVTLLTLKYLKDTPMFEIEKILSIRQGGGTNFESGYLGAVRNFDTLISNTNTNSNSNSNSSNTKRRSKKEREYDNRIIMLTDACPNRGKTDQRSLLGMVNSNAVNSSLPIFTTFVGVGLDFNTDLISNISKVRGANYFAVHSNADFIKKMDQDFKYIVSPLVFNLRLVLKNASKQNEGGDDRLPIIERVYGSDDINKANGEIMKVQTLFPSPVDDEGDTKGFVL